MKLRHGFVSNSSSSSFLVAFSCKPKDEQEIQKLLFGDDLGYFWYNKPIPTIVIARNVFQAMQDQTPLTMNQARIVILDDSPAIFKEFKVQKDKYGCWMSPPTEGGGEVMTDFGECDVPHEEALEYLDKNFKDKLIYKFDFSDNDGEPWTTMEHGGIFSKLPCFRFNHH